MKGSLLWQPGLGHFLEVSGGIDLDNILTRGLSGKRGTVTRIREGLKKNRTNLGFWMNLRLPLPPKELGPCYMVWEYFLAHLTPTE